MIRRVPRPHEGKGWARYKAKHPARQVVYTTFEYQRNRRLAIEREPTCHWRFRGCSIKSTTADHLISVARGGDNSLGNLVGACSNCNQRRGGADGRATRKRRSQ